MKRQILYMFFFILFPCSFCACKKNVSSTTGQLKKLEKLMTKDILLWDDLGYEGQTEDVICLQLGNPSQEKIMIINIHNRRNFHPLYRPLTRFIPLGTDTILIKELFWNKPSHVLYIWFVEENSIWHAVDGIEYDPNCVEF